MKRNSLTVKRNRDYANSTEKRCLARGSHDDAIALVEYLLANSGKTDLSAEKLAVELGWEQRFGGGMRQSDMARFHRARNHVKDGRAKDGKPCTGYSLHYRASGQGALWMLVDPSGDLDHHLHVAIEKMRGDIQQQVAFRTVNGRRIADCEQASELCLKRGDGIGHRLMLEAAMEYRKYGALSDPLIAEVNLWLAAAA